MKQFHSKAINNVSMNNGVVKRNHLSNKKLLHSQDWLFGHRSHSLAETENGEMIKDQRFLS